MTTATLSKNKNQIQLVTEYLMFKDFYSRWGVSDMQPYNLVVMFQTIESDNTGDVWLGTVKTIKKHISL